MIMDMCVAFITSISIFCKAFSRKSFHIRKGLPWPGQRGANALRLTSDHRYQRKHLTFF